MQALTPLVQTLSIDEAALDLSGTEALHGAPPAATLTRFARQVEQQLNLTVSIGLARNRLLAKLAAGRDKPRGFAIFGAEAASTLAPSRSASSLASAPRWKSAWPHAASPGLANCRPSTRARPSNSSAMMAHLWSAAPRERIPVLSIPPALPDRSAPKPLLIATSPTAPISNATSGA